MSDDDKSLERRSTDVREWRLPLRANLKEEENFVAGEIVEWSSSTEFIDVGMLFLGFRRSCTREALELER